MPASYEYWMVYTFQPAVCSWPGKSRGIWSMHLGSCHLHRRPKWSSWLLAWVWLSYNHFEHFNSEPAEEISVCVCVSLCLANSSFKTNLLKNGNRDKCLRSWLAGSHASRMTAWWESTLPTTWTLHEQCTRRATPRPHQAEGRQRPKLPFKGGHIQLTRMQPSCLKNLPTGSAFQHCWIGN